MAEEKEKDPKKEAGAKEEKGKAQAKKNAKGAKKKEASPEGRLKAFFAARSPRETTALKVAGIILIVMFIDLVIIRPVNNYLSHINAMISEEETVIPKRLEILKYRSKILKDYADLEPLLTQPDVSQEEEIARFLRDIERISTQADLFISNIDPVTVDSNSERTYELTVNIAGKGTLDRIADFIVMLEHSNPAIRVSGFNLRSKAKDSDDLSYTFSIVKLGVRAQWTPDTES